MQTLNTLSTPEEKLAALCKKYAELVSAYFFVSGSGAGGGHCSSEHGSCLRRQKMAVGNFFLMLRGTVQEHLCMFWDLCSAGYPTIRG